MGLPVIRNIVLIVMFHIIQICYSTKVVKVDIILAACKHRVAVNSEADDAESGAYAIIGALLDNSVLSVRCRRNRNSHLFPSAECECSKIKLKVVSKIVLYKQVNGMIHIASCNPDRNSLCYAFNRNRTC